MKRSLLLIMITSSGLMGMQNPDLIEQFITAIRSGNLQQVASMLNAHPSLQNNIRTYTNFATEPILKFAIRNPALKPQYMQIARFLVDRGANIHPTALQELKSYEQSQKASITSKPVILTPVTKPTAPGAAKPAAPAPIVTPQPTPKPAATVQPTALPSGMQPADPAALKELLRNPANEAAIQQYLRIHSISNLTKEQKDEIFTSFLAIVSGGLPFFNAAQFKSAVIVVKLLQEKGFVPTTAYQKNMLEEIRKGIPNSSRSGYFSTELVKAIKEKKSLAEIKRLVEQEKEDINQAGRDQIFPLKAATIAKSKEIAEFLLSRGAKVDDLLGYERKDLSDLLGRPF